MKLKHNHYPVLFGCFVLMGASYSFPLLLRLNSDNKNTTERKLTGSQRQRGMYIAAGQHGNVSFLLSSLSFLLSLSSSLSSLSSLS